MALFSSPQRTATTIYGLAVPVAGAGAFWFESIAFDATAHRQWAAWDVYALNLLPSAMAGILVFAVAALTLHAAMPATVALRAWARLSVPLATGGLLVVLIVTMSWNNPDFGLFGQLLEWPASAISAGVLVEVVITHVARRRAHVSAA